MRPDELTIVRRIVRANLPEGYRAYAFGSRATGIKVKPWSDLDLAIDGPQPLPCGVVGSMSDAFDEAPLDWKVDVLDMHDITPEFRRIVDATKVPLD